MRALPRVLALHCLVHATPVGRLRKWQIPKRVEHARHYHFLCVVNDGAPDWAVHPTVQLRTRKSRFNSPAHAALEAGSAKQRLRVLVQVDAAALHARTYEGVAVGVACLCIDKTCTAITHPPPPAPPPPTSTSTTATSTTTAANQQHHDRPHASAERRRAHDAPHHNIRLSARHGRRIGRLRHSASCSRAPANNCTVKLFRTFVGHDVRSSAEHTQPRFVCLDQVGFADTAEKHIRHEHDLASRQCPRDDNQRRTVRLVAVPANNKSQHQGRNNNSNSDNNAEDCGWRRRRRRRQRWRWWWW